MSILTSSEFKAQVKQELTGNILPFWMNILPDPENGGFYGAVTNDLRPLNDVPRSAVLNTRLLWTFSAAYRALNDPAYLVTAQRALGQVTGPFWDADNGGVYWSIDARGQPVSDRKHTYTQSFAVYALSEYFLATRDSSALHRARALTALVDRHARDERHGGYYEGCDRRWNRLEDARLSALEIVSPKSTNTLLHAMEANTTLLACDPTPENRARLAELVNLFIHKIYDPQTRHFRLFFEEDWTSLSPNKSFGHDIEATWLLQAAAEALDEEQLVQHVQRIALEVAQAVYEEGLDTDGAVLSEATPAGITHYRKEWWEQAEALVGFTNAWQIGGGEHFAQAALRSWELIQTRFVDRQHGDWFKMLDRSGQPIADYYKAGPWECPYHHARACLELLARL